MPLRDQQRALHAYNAVATVQRQQQKDYEIAVNDLGANILRSGLCAAIASVQRRREVRPARCVGQPPHEQEGRRAEEGSGTRPH